MYINIHTHKYIYKDIKIDRWIGRESVQALNANFRAWIQNSLFLVLSADAGAAGASGRADAEQ